MLHVQNGRLASHGGEGKVVQCKATAGAEVPDARYAFYAWRDAMNIVMNGPALVLDRLQRFALVDAQGAVAQVKSGRVWITLEHDRRDIFLEPGETWVIDRDGLTLVQAEEPST